jgi:hypothetical protein
LEELTSLARQLAFEQQMQGMAKLCGICTSADHHTDECPALQETSSSDLGQAPVNGVFLFPIINVISNKLFNTKGYINMNSGTRRIRGNPR